MAFPTPVLGVAVDALAFSDVPTADEVVQIGNIVYTWKASPSAAYEVDIGADAAGCAANLIAAINASGTAGSTYGTGTLANPYVTAEEGTTTAEVTLTARAAGAWINGLYLAMNGDNAADAVTFAQVDEAGSVDGSGTLHGWLSYLLDECQLNSQVISQVRGWTAAVD